MRDDPDGALARRAAAFEEAERVARDAGLADAIRRLEALSAAHPEDTGLARLLERYRRM